MGEYSSYESEVQPGNEGEKNHPCQDRDPGTRPVKMGETYPDGDKGQEGDKASYKATKDDKAPGKNSFEL